ncbi:MAG TPA: SurA N-terminal domain-containing protein [Burkholderiales bacterium]|nr:SurA N-terminal domain-containing protein [Burkholderiales bacterium]
MFDFIEKNKKWIMIAFLVLIVPPFMLFGVDAYFRDGGGGQSVAVVGDYRISTDEFSQALRERQAAIQRASQGRINSEALDNPELRQAVLESLIQRRLLIQQAQSSGIVVRDGQLKTVIEEQPIFRDESGRFSYDRYTEALRIEGMTPAIFEARTRQDLMIRQLASGLAETGFLPRTEADLLLRRISQEREVSHATLSPETYLPKVRIEAAAVKQYYDANPAEFRVPEQARVEYLALSVDALMRSIEASPDEVRKYYEGNRKEYGVEESRQASHILLAADPAAGPDAKQKARARAEEIQRELQKNPDGFAAAAKKYSQDPGSAANGGDLGGRINRGSMKDTPQLEKVIFESKPDEIPPPVETQHGYHIVKVTAVHPATVKPFEEVRGQIEQDVKKRLAGRRFAELAEGFSNTVYEQSESLKPAAELIKAEPRVSGWISRESAEAPLNHPRLLAAIFSDEVLKERRNSEAVEVAPGTLVAARLVEHKPGIIQPFDEVRAGLEKLLARREAARLAAEEGRSMLDALRQGKPINVSWSAPQVVSREDMKDLPAALRRQAFRVDASTLPAYSGVDSAGGDYLLLRVTRVHVPENVPPEKSKQLAEQMNGVLAQETLSAYVASIRQQAGVKIFKEQLEKKQ